jgi:hypothetical protein
MNTRIRELLKQATKTVDPENRVWVFSKVDQAKFAELIVKECMDAVGDGPMQRPEIQRIKARFGVEYYEPIEKAFGVAE